jgi:hypothetical protein
LRVDDAADAAGTALVAALAPLAADAAWLRALALEPPTARRVARRTQQIWVCGFIRNSEY